MSLRGSKAALRGSTLMLVLKPCELVSALTATPFIGIVSSGTPFKAAGCHWFLNQPHGAFNTGTGGFRETIRVRTY